MVFVIYKLRISLKGGHRGKDLCALSQSTFAFPFYIGPCGGKTTVQATLREFFTNMGWKVYCVPEAATVLLGYVLTL